MVQAEQALVERAAHVRARHSISYADAFCVATAHRLDASVLTGDPEFRAVEDEIPIIWIR